MIERAADSLWTSTRRDNSEKLIPMACKHLELSVTSAVATAQAHYYGHARTFPPGSDSAPTPRGPDEEEFIAQRDSFYLATVSEIGWPYVQHRGSLRGFCVCSIRIRSRPGW